MKSNTTVRTLFVAPTQCKLRSFILFIQYVLVVFSMHVPSLTEKRYKIRLVPTWDLSVASLSALRNSGHSKKEIRFKKEYFCAINFGAKRRLSGGPS